MPTPPPANLPHPGLPTVDFGGLRQRDDELPSTIHTGITVRAVPFHREEDLPRVRGYEVLKAIGRGGMGIVYEARHRELGRRVAIKMLRGDALDDPSFRERFRAEAEVIARLQHPNIIQVFEVGAAESMPGEWCETPFIALEYVDGGSLADRVGTPQPPADAARIVGILARAAHVAHGLGVIHRDLKPANVLLTRDGEPKIADFGIARRIDCEQHAASRRITRENTVVGTPEYMSPEQLDGVPATASSDVYSLGVILYEMLTGRVPFQGTTFADTVRLAAEQDPVPPRRLQPGVPRDIETICLKCLEKQPARRYASAAALADDLALWAGGRSIRARPTGPLERTVRWASRNPSVAALSFATILCAMVGSVGILWKWNDARTALVEAEKEKSRAVAAKDSERRERYRLNLLAASRTLGQNDINGVRRWLDDAPAEHRDWVWKLLGARLDRSLDVWPPDAGRPLECRPTPDSRFVVVRDSSGSIRVRDNVSKRDYGPYPVDPGAHPFLPTRDGSAFAVTRADRSIEVRDSFTGRVRAVLAGHTDFIHSLAFTPDGSRLVSTSFDRTVRVWDAAGGRELSSVRVAPSFEKYLTASPGGRYVAGDGEGRFPSRIWEAATGREVSAVERKNGPVHSHAFSRDEKILMTVNLYPDTSLCLWEVSSGRLLATLRGHDNQINHCDISPDGERLVTASLDRTLCVWDISPGALAAHGPDGAKLLHRLEGHNGSVLHAAFSHDGGRIASASWDCTVRYWDAKTGRALGVSRGHTGHVQQVGFVADKATVVSASLDGTLRLWDSDEVERGHAIRGHTNFAYSVAWHPDGERIASASWDGTARVWHATTGRELMKLPHGEGAIVPSVAWHPGGRWLATIARDDAVRLWDAETGKELHRWKMPTRDWRDSRVAFSPDGGLLASGTCDGSIYLWNVRTRERVPFAGKQGDAVRDVAFSPDGKWLASTGEEGDATVCVWDVATGEEVAVLRGHEAGVYSLAWNAKGTAIASGARDGTVRLWDTATWRESGVLRNGSSAFGLAFSPDGLLLACGCADNLIRLWTADTHAQVAELGGHREYIHQLAFSPDGSRLASASGDKSLRIWDSLSRAEREKLSEAKIKK